MAKKTDGGAVTEAPVEKAPEKPVEAKKEASGDEAEEEDDGKKKKKKGAKEDPKEKGKNRI